MPAAETACHLNAFDIYHNCSFFSETGAALLYDCDTMSPAGVLRTAGFFTIGNGKIKSIRLVFDATELRKLMAG